MANKIQLCILWMRAQLVWAVFTLPITAQKLKLKTNFYTDGMCSKHKPMLIVTCQDPTQNGRMNRKTSMMTRKPVPKSFPNELITWLVVAAVRLLVIAFSAIQWSISYLS